MSLEGVWTQEVTPDRDDPVTVCSLAQYRSDHTITSSAANPSAESYNNLPPPQVVGQEIASAASSAYGFWHPVLGQQGVYSIEVAYCVLFRNTDQVTTIRTTGTITISDCGTRFSGTYTSTTPGPQGQSASGRIEGERVYGP